MSHLEKQYLCYQQSVKNSKDKQKENFNRLGLHFMCITSSMKIGLKNVLEPMKTLKWYRNRLENYRSAWAGEPIRRRHWQAGGPASGSVRGGRLQPSPRGHMLATRLFSMHFANTVDEVSQDVFQKRLFEDREQVLETKWRIS